MFRWVKGWFAFAQPGFLSALIGAGASLLGNVFSSRTANRAQEQNQGQAQVFNAEEAEKARAFNAQQAQEARIFNSAEAAKARDWSGEQAQTQMSFQERMSNTQYQRAMQDMRQSGLNPILAYSQGGAGTPIGSAGSSSAASAGAASAGAASSPGPLPVSRPDLGNLLSSAVQLAQIDNVNAQTRKTEAETKVVESEMVDEDEGRQYPRTYTAMEKQQRGLLLARQARHESDKMAVTQATEELVKEEVANAVKQGRRIEADTRDITANAILRELAQSEAKAGSQYWRKYPETYGIAQGLKITGETLSSALGLKRLLGR